MPNNGRVLVPEVFYEDRRCAYHQARLRADPASVAFIVYDFIPWLHPDRIGVEQSAHLMPYLRLLRTARRLAFISGATCADYARRVMRGRGVNGIVLPLGCDSLGLARQAFSAGRRGFLCIGSIDGRKNQDRVLRAFQMLWARGHEIPLTVVGDAFPRVDVTEFEATRSHRLFAWHRHAGDAIVGDLLRTARGTIYASEIEGYGIPPMESLYAGVPVICAEALPSVAELPFAGQVRLAKITPETIADAVVMLSNDDIAARLWKEAQHLTLATWGDFARQTASWMQSAVSPTDPPAATN